MTRLLALLLVSIFTFTSNPSSAQQKMDVVFVLDISGSTGGILSSVRGKFWEIQNEISRLTPAPDYRFGLVCMGRPSFLKENNYVKVVSPLTDDIDPGAYEFFQIRDVTAPGRFYMGDALETALHNLEWSEDPNALKVMFVCGNGGIASGPGYRTAVKLAKEKGIILHSLYFETYVKASEQAEWKDMAESTGGKLYRIGLKEPNMVIDKMYDPQMLVEASQMINSTYVYYNKDGLDRFEMQANLDEEAELQGEDQIEARTFFKANHLYQGKHSDWDLVDLHTSGEGYAGGANRKTIDESLKDLSDDMLLLHVKEKSYERKEYISIIKLLSTQREEYMKKKREALENFRTNKTFFGVVNTVLFDMAKEKGMSLDY